MRIFTLVMTIFVFCLAQGNQIGEANRVLEWIASESNFSGVVSVFTDQDVLFQKAVGYGLPDKQNIIQMNDGFRIGSLTKEFTAYLILDAAARNEIDINSKISRFIPAKGALGEVTIRQILNHSAGLSDQTVYENYHQKPCATASNSNLRPWLKQIITDPYKVGKFKYSNAGYSLLACILERKTKLRFDKLLKERVFKPLKMNSSGVAWSKTESLKVVTGKTKTDEVVDFDTSKYFGAGDVVSNTADLIKWQRYLNQSSAFKEMVSNLLPGKDSWKYGYGVIVDSDDGQPYYWASGNTPGFVSELAWLPAKQIGIVILSNRKDFPLRSKFVRPLSSQILDVFIGKKNFTLPTLKN